MEAERSCAFRNSHYQQSQHASVGGTTGLSWLGTTAPKASVFAPPNGTSNSASQSNPWTGQVEKSSADSSSRFPMSGSPGKLENNNSRATSEQVTPSVERGDNLEGSTSTSEVTGAPGSGVAASAPASNASQNNFHAFTNPTKEEGESRAVPLTPTSGGATSSLGQQHQPTVGDGQVSSEQSSSTPLNVCQHPQSIPNNQIYQQPSLDMKQESLMTSSTAASILPYSHAYMAAGMGSYGGALSSYPPSHDNKASLSLYSTKNKSKNRTNTGKIFYIYCHLYSSNNVKNYYLCSVDRTKRKV